MPVTEQQGSSPTDRSPRRLLPSGFATLRDVVSFAAGLAIIANEVWLSETAEPTVIAVGIAMLGLPAVFGADERSKSKSGETSDASTPPEQPASPGEKAQP